MKAVMSINIRSKADDNYVDYSGYHIVDIAFGPPKEEDTYTSYALERMAIEEVLVSIASRKWIALYGDIFDLELGAVMVNVGQYEAIDVDVCRIMTDDEFRQLYLNYLKQEERKAASDLAEIGIKEDK